MSKIFEALTDEEDAIMQWKYGYCGDFYQALWEAIARADLLNLVRLEMGFPLEVGAFRRFAHEEGWWPSVREKAIKEGYLERSRKCKVE